VPITAASAGVVRWAHGPHVFELTSSDPGVIARGAVVFGHALASRTDVLPIASWRVTTSSDGSQWTVESPDDGLDATTRDSIGGAVTVVEYRAVSALLRADVVSLHAALVAQNGRGALLLGAPESGKSTLATALWRRGYAFLGDDTALVDPMRTSAASVPRRVALRRASRALLGDEWWARTLSGAASDSTSEGLVFHPREFDDQPSPDEVPVHVCLFLNRPSTVGVPGVPRLMSEAAATLAMLPYSNLAQRLDAGAVIARLAPFAARVRSYDLARADLASMCDTVDRLLEEGAPS